MKRLLLSLTLIGLLVAACGLLDESVLTPAPLPTTAPTSTPTPEPTEAQIPVDAPPAQLAALRALVAALGVTPEQITIVSVEEMDWPDGCLGVQRPNVACLQVITPGFRIVLEANGAQYEYHTDTDGRVVVLATGLTWHREGGIAGFCDNLIISLSGEAFAKGCEPEGSGKPGAALSETEQAQLDKWLAAFGVVSVTVEDDPAVSDAMAVTLTPNGFGTGRPTEADKQAMIEFAQAVYTRLKN